MMSIKGFRTKNNLYKTRSVSLEVMKGRIASFRRGRHHTYNNQMIVHVDDVDTKDDAEELVGKDVTWDTGKREIEGEVRDSHGNSGAIRVLFESGMPGQALGQEVTIS